MFLNSRSMRVNGNHRPSLLYKNSNVLYSQTKRETLLQQESSLKDRSTLNNNNDNNDNDKKLYVSLISTLSHAGISLFFVDLRFYSTMGFNNKISAYYTTGKIKGRL